MVAGVRARAVCNGGGHHVAVVAGQRPAGDLVDDARVPGAVRLHHALGQAGGPGGVEHRGTGVLIEVRELRDCRGGAQASLVFGHETLRQWADDILQQDARAQIRQLLVNAVQYRQELAMGEEYPRAAVVERVGDLFGGQAHVHHHQHRADHRHGEVGLQVAVAVPVHHRHGIAVPDPERGQQPGQPADARLQRPVVEADRIAIDDLLAWVHRQWRVQQLLDQQRTGGGAGSRGE
ncbi:hypothetical protein G6F40_014475 [Rhizopus arrhizus]|nr:hypothetical protein G6F40_014475 [Rhizopus arrhizus]